MAKSKSKTTTMPKSKVKAAVLEKNKTPDPVSVKTAPEKKVADPVKKAPAPKKKPKTLQSKVEGAEVVQQAKKKILQGIVVSTKSHKTAVVKVERKQKHAFYKKTITSHKKYHVHDEHEQTKDGNVVRIIACRPISALKKWRLLEVVK